MTRSEAKTVMLNLTHLFEDEEVTDALKVAIEALTEPKTIIGIDIPYGSDKGLATVFKGNEKMVLEEVKEIMSVVRCKDCRYYSPINEDKPYPCEVGIMVCNKNDYCSYGERREP